MSVAALVESKASPVRCSGNCAGDPETGACTCPRPRPREHYFYVDPLQGRKSCLSCGLICAQHLFTGGWIYAVILPGSAEVTDFEERRTEPACPGFWSGALPPEEVP